MKKLNIAVEHFNRMPIESNKGAIVTFDLTPDGRANIREANAKELIDIVEVYKSAFTWFSIKDRTPEYKQWIITYDSKFDDIDKTRFRASEIDYDFWIPFPEIEAKENG